MINNKLFLLVGSILIVLVILFFLRKRIFKTENFKDYTIFYPNQENPTMTAIMSNIENYDIKNDIKFYKFNGVDSYIYTELLNDTSYNTIELNLSVRFTDLNNKQTILSGMDWDITIYKDNKIKLNKNSSVSDLFIVNVEDLLRIRSQYNKYDRNEQKLELFLSNGSSIMFNQENLDLSKIFFGKKFIDENTSINFFNGLMGGIIINSINLESLTEAAAPETAPEAAPEAAPETAAAPEVTTQELVSQLQQGPEPVQEGGLILPNETTSTTTTTPAPLGETTTQSTTGATTQSTTGATTQSTTGDITPAPLGETTTQSTTGATTQSTQSGEQLIKQSMIAPTVEPTTGATTQSTTTTLALENNTEILGGINETQPEVDYKNTINMQNIAQNLNNNVNLALENTINNALQVNNVAPQVNNVTPQVNNVTPQVNNVTPQVNNVTPQVNNVTPQVNNTPAQVNNTTAQVNKTINNALQANIVRRVEKIENILASAPVAYNSLDKFNDITIDINFV